MILTPLKMSGDLIMLEKFKFIFKDFKKASKYTQIYDKYAQNPFIKNEVKTYVWVEKMESKAQYGS